MKVVFICGCIEDGKDGIGDYTKKLSIECFKYSITPYIIAINDKYVSQIETGLIEGVSFVRIPEILPLKAKEDKIREMLTLYGPIDWVSLQIVSYGLHSKGMIYEYINPFKRLFKNLKLHVMMHELWVGEEKEAPFKAKILGRLQKVFVIRLLKALKPAIINTSVNLYAKMLENAGVKASVLPLFSNINYQPVSNNLYLKNIPDEFITNRKNYLIGCVFGSIYHKSWDMNSLFFLLGKKSKTENKKILIISVGKISTGKKLWESLPAKYPDFEFLTLGIRDESFISGLMSNFIDFGIITTPAIIAGKSGTYMAFLEHGLPVFSKRNELSFNFDTFGCLQNERLIQVNENSELEFPVHTSPVSLLKNTGEIFVNALKETK